MASLPKRSPLWRATLYLDNLKSLRAKKIHIEIKRLGDTLKEAGAVYDALAKGRDAKKKSAVYFSTLEDMRRVLTGKRIELLKVIKERKPSSVYELAKMTGNMNEGNET